MRTTQKDESSEDYLIDDHGIMHVIPRRLGADSTHTYSNWRDRRQVGYSFFFIFFSVGGKRDLLNASGKENC